MAKDTSAIRTRFQESLELLNQEWSRFNVEFPTEEDCAQELYRISASNNYRCPNCSESEFGSAGRKRKLKCLACGLISSPTAGTFFHGMRKPRAWLARVWFLERGVCVSSFKFSKLLQISSSAALNIFRRLTHVIFKAFNEDVVCVPSSQFMDVMCKRSRETPAQKHPRAEEEILLDKQRKGGRTGAARAGAATGNRMNRSSQCMCLTLEKPPIASTGIMQTDVSNLAFGKVELEILSHLSDDPIEADDLCKAVSIDGGLVFSTLTLLELYGLIVRLPGDRYVKRVTEQKLQESEQVQADGGILLSHAEAEFVTEFGEFIRFFFHGISRKHLQHYLAAYWCFSDRSRWQCESIIPLCDKHGPVSYNDVLEYVTPMVAKVFRGRSIDLCNELRG